MRAYCYIAIDKSTGQPVAGGDNKYHLRHKIEGGLVDPNKVRFFRTREAYIEADSVVELSLEEVMKKD